jgi:hypothetical protein
VTRPATQARFGWHCRRFLPIVLLAILLAACRPYGPGFPVCGDVAVVTVGDETRLTVTERTGEARTVRAAHLVQAQAVPSAEWGLCVDQIPSTWQASVPQARSGEFDLRFFAPDLGDGFLTASLTPSCSPSSDAEREATAVDDVERLIAVHDRSVGVRVVVIPVATGHEVAAVEVAAQLIARELQGNPVRVALSRPIEGTAAERIQAVLDDGDAALVVDDDYELRGELELRVPDHAEGIVSRLGGVLAELGERAEPPRYAATWWHVFEGGCVTYRFDASGPAAATVADDARRALGTFPLGELRWQLAELEMTIEPAG